MKRILPLVLAATGIFLVLSCTNVEPARRNPVMIANVDPFSVGTVDVFLDRLLSATPQRIEVEVIFYPRLNSVALQYRHEFITYRQFWDEVARRQFAAALERYKEDFAERRLVDRFSQTRSVYGRAIGHLEWETFILAVSRTRISYPVVELGYRFRGTSPFFTTLMQSAPEIDVQGGDSNESPQIAMYFTRAQGDELVRLFDQAFLLGLLSEQRSRITEETILLDEYHEFDD
jgi:hypothetical protein